MMTAGLRATATRALAVDVRGICLKRNLLVGNNPDVVDLLKDSMQARWPLRNCAK